MLEDNSIEVIWAEFRQIDEMNRQKYSVQPRTPASASNHNSESPACSSGQSNSALSDNEVQIMEVCRPVKEPEKIVNTPVVSKPQLMNFIPSVPFRSDIHQTVINKDGAPRPTSSVGFSVSHTTLSDLNSNADRTIIFFNHRNFQPILDKISGQSIVAFIGDEKYASEVKNFFGKPPLKVETRVKALQPLASPNQQPANVNSTALIYCIETKERNYQLNDVFFFQTLYEKAIPLGTFMRISELGRILQITEPSELLVVNFDPIVARGIYDTACNITNLKWIRVMDDSEAVAMTLVSRLQMRINSQPPVVEPRKEAFNLEVTKLPEITTEIINVTPFELPVEILTKETVKARPSARKKPNARTTKHKQTEPTSENEEELEPSTSKQARETSLERLKREYSKPFVIVCTLPELPFERPVTPPTSSNDRPEKRSRLSVKPTTKTPQQSASKNLRRTLRTASTENNEEHCGKCGEITKTNRGGICRKCADGKAIPTPQTSTPISADKSLAYCMDCKQLRKLHRLERCRKCYQGLHIKEPDNARLVECSSCKQIKKLYSKGKCRNCYCADPIATLTQFINDTTFADTTTNTEMDTSAVRLKMEAEPLEPGQPSNFADLVRQLKEA
ncbi:hypothetical protein M3Y97_01119200 [Aphelenchoides bicaudatus]|nr:hypothetical protein M3Y97_01119200 [Aphelenchoides bicaudatus]